MLTLYEVGKKT